MPDTDSLIAQARAEYLAGERFLEFRLDYLRDPEAGIAAMKKFLVKQSDCTILATCRRRQNQGKFTGSIEEQLRILNAAREEGAHAVDLEIESAKIAKSSSRICGRLRICCFPITTTGHAAAPRSRAEAHDAHSGARIQGGDDGSQAVRYLARAGAGEVVPQDPHNPPGDG